MGGRIASEATTDVNDVGTNDRALRLTRSNPVFSIEDNDYYVESDDM